MIEHSHVLPLNRLEPPLDFQEVFGRQAPVELEIGFGKGLFLLDRARRLPDRDFLGVEIAAKYLKRTAERLARERLGHVRVVREDAGYFLDRWIPPGSLEVIHVYYPDPWPKRRHRRRRIVQPGFVALAASRLAPQGELRVATDFEEYFRSMIEVLGGEPTLESASDAPEAWTGWMTNFARKYAAERRGVHRACFRRSSEPEGPGGCDGLPGRRTQALPRTASMDV